MMGCDVSVQKRRLPVWVRPFEEYDVEWLYRHETAPAIIETGRLRGVTPTRGQFAAPLLGGADEATVVMHGDDRIGVVTLYDLSIRHHTCYLGATRVVAGRTITFMRGVDQVVRRAFCERGIRKIYLDCPAFNLPLIASGFRTIYDIEGRLNQDIYFDGAYHDRYILSLRRTRWVS